MLRDFAAAAFVAVALAACGIKGPLRPATPPAPAATDVGPPAPSPDPNPEAARRP